MKRLANILLGVLFLLGQPALTSLFAGPVAVDPAAGAGCACGKSCCVSRSDDPAPRVPVPAIPSSTRADFHGALSLPSTLFVRPPPADEPSPVVIATGLPPAFPVPIYNRDCSYLI